MVKMKDNSNWSNLHGAVLTFKNIIANYETAIDDV